MRAYLGRLHETLLVHAGMSPRESKTKRRRFGKLPEYFDIAMGSMASVRNEKPKP